MDKDIWEKHLKELTADSVDRDLVWRESAHMSQTFYFFQSLHIDHKDKVFYDIGCNSSMLKARIKSKWIGCDIFEKEGVIKADAHNLPFEDKVADIVYSSHVLEHTLSPIICVSEMKRICKEDGDIIISVPFDPHHMGDDHNYVFTQAGWELLIRRAGLKILTRKDIGSMVCFHCKKENE